MRNNLRMTMIWPNSENKFGCGLQVSKLTYILKIDYINFLYTPFIWLHVTPHCNRHNH